MAKPDHLADDCAILAAVETFQQAWNAALTTTDELVRRALLGVQSTALERIFAELHPDLRKIASAWKGSQVGREHRAHASTTNDALESLAMSLFADIACALPTCKLRPGGNVRAYLLQIARYQLHKQEYTVYRSDAATHTAPSTEMWLATPQSQRGVWHKEFGSDESYLAEPEDPDSIDFDQRLLAARDNQAYLEAIIRFWKIELNSEDHLIVTLRWATDPPLSFQAIAQRLGSGWLVDTVRQRHRRILQRTLRYLIEQGLVNPDEPAR